MARVVWTRRGLADLNRATAYIKRFSPLAAQRMTLRIRSAADTLGEHPERGRPARYGRRELTVVRPYLIIYRLQVDVVEILNVRHGARRPD